MDRAGRIWILATLACLAAAGLGAQQPGRTEIQVENLTGNTIYFLFVSSSEADTWGEDLLGRDVLANREVYRAVVRSGSESFDVRAVDANENEYIIWGWSPYLREPRVIISPAALVGGRPGSSGAAAEAISWISIVNDTNYIVEEVHVLPAGESDWRRGEQVLPEGRVIHPRENYRLEIDVSRSSTYVYSIMLVDEDGDRYIKPNVDLELTTELVYTLSDLHWR